MRGTIVALAFSAWLAACATAPQEPSQAPPTPSPLLHDELFEPPSHPVRVEDIFAVSDEMKEFLRNGAFYSLRRDDKRRSLVDLLYRERGLRLEYDATRTRDAAEAFAARTGNCLSLVIMTAALAKELGLPVTYQGAEVEETWTRASGLMLGSGHVNIALGRRSLAMDIYDAEAQLVVDFLPPDELKGMKTRPLPEKTIVAMFMNNRAAEALAGARTDDAYWYAKASVQADPDFVQGWNTLGAVYLHRDSPALAEAAFTRVLSQKPDSIAALTNRAIALRSLGREAEAKADLDRVARLDPHPPFEYFDRGMKAFHDGDFRSARAWFAKEVDRAPYFHEFQYWLGVAELRLGEVDSARHHLQLALENSTTRQDRAIYAAKLDRLKSLRTQ